MKTLKSQLKDLWGNKRVLVVLGTFLIALLVIPLIVKDNKTISEKNNEELTWKQEKIKQYEEIRKNPIRIDIDWDNNLKITDGNIFYRDENLEEIQITSRNLDVGAILSPDKEKIAFLRQTTNDPTIECPEHPDFGGNSWHEIWLYNLTTQEETLLTSAENTCHGYIEKLVFSLDEKKIYFKHSKWVTSSAIEVVDIETKEVNFITGGNTLEVIQEGEYRGNLLVSKHKYHPAPNYGAYSASCIVSPEGEEIKILD